MIIMMVMLNCLGAKFTSDHIDPTDKDCDGYTYEDEDDDDNLRFGMMSNSLI